MTACVVLNPKQEFDIGSVARAQHQHQQQQAGAAGAGTRTPDPSPPAGERQASGKQRFALGPFKIIVPVVARGASGPVSDAEVDVDDGAQTASPGGSPAIGGGRGGGGDAGRPPAAAATASAAGAAGAAAEAAAEGAASAASGTGKLAADAEALDGVAPLRRTKSILKRTDTGNGGANGNGRGASGELAAPPSRTVSWRDEGELGLDLEIVREFERSESDTGSDDEEEDEPKPATMCCVIS